MLVQMALKFNRGVASDDSKVGAIGLNLIGHFQQLQLLGLARVVNGPEA